MVINFEFLYYSNDDDFAASDSYRNSFLEVMDIKD